MWISITVHTVWNSFIRNSELPKILEIINILFEIMNRILWMSLKLLIFIKLCSLFGRKCSIFRNAFGNFYITSKMLGFLMILQLFKPIMVQSMPTYFYKLNIGFAGPKKSAKTTEPIRPTFIVLVPGAVSFC